MNKEQSFYFALFVLGLNYQGDICLQFVQSKYMPNKNRAFIDFMK